MSIPAKLILFIVVLIVLLIALIIGYIATVKAFNALIFELLEEDEDDHSKRS